MIYVISFEDEDYKYSNMVARLIGDDVFTPLEIEDEMDDDDMYAFSEYVKENISENDTVIVFMEDVDGPSSNYELYEWIRHGGVDVNVYVSKGI